MLSYFRSLYFIYLTPSADSYPLADPVFHRTFSSSFERYYNNKAGNGEGDDNSSLSGRRESRISLLSVESYPNVSCAMNLQDGLAGKVFFSKTNFMIRTLVLCIRMMTT
jgi:hypothetical protein